MLFRRKGAVTPLKVVKKIEGAKPSIKKVLSQKPVIKPVEVKKEEEVVKVQDK